MCVLANAGVAAEVAEGLSFFSDISSIAVVEVCCVVFAFSSLGLFWLVHYAYRKRGYVTDAYAVFVASFLVSLVLKAIGLAGIWKLAHEVRGSSWFPYVALFLFIAVPLIDCVLGVFTFGVVKSVVPAVDMRRIKRLPVIRNYRLMGWVLVCLSLCSFAVHLLIFRGVRMCEPMAEEARTMVCFVGFLGIVGQAVLFVVLVRLARRYSRYSRICREIGRSLAGLDTNLAPILFLRSFKLDVVVGGRSFDEYVCGRFVDNDIPIVSLCDPDENVPSGGSIKIQAKDDGWKELIQKLIPMCRAVVMYEGITGGLRWEIGAVRDMVRPERFFVVSPPTKYRIAAWFGCGSWTLIFHRFFSRRGIRAAYRFVWERFKRKMDEAGIELPDKPIPDESIVSYARGWNAPNVIRCKRKDGVIGMVLGMTDGILAADCDYRELSALIAAYERDQKVPDENRALISRVNRLIVCCALGSVVLISLLAFVVGRVWYALNPNEDVLLQENVAALENVFRSVGLAFDMDKTGPNCVFSAVTNVPDFMPVELAVVVNEKRVCHTGSISVREDLKSQLPGFANEYNRTLASAENGYVYVESNGLVRVERTLSARAFWERDQADWVVGVPQRLFDEIALRLLQLLDKNGAGADANAARRESEDARNQTEN